LSTNYVCVSVLVPMFACYNIAFALPVLTKFFFTLDRTWLARVKQLPLLILLLSRCSR